MDRWSFNDFSSSTSRVSSKNSNVLVVEETSLSIPPAAVLLLLSSTGVGEVCLAAEMELTNDREIYFLKRSFLPAFIFSLNFSLS